MPGSRVDAPGLRERTRLAVRRDIASGAMRLFLRHGFEEVTVDQIAREVGISSRSFFRYFATKEDIVLGDLAEAGSRVALALQRRPAGEGAWAALRGALQVLLDEPAHPQPDLLAISRMLLRSPALRARQVEKQAQWQQLLLPHVVSRLATGTEEERGPDGDPRAAVLVACALACLQVAAETWVDAEGRVDPARILDDAFEVVRG